MLGKNKPVGLDLGADDDAMPKVSETEVPQLQTQPLSRPQTAFSKTELNSAPASSRPFSRASSIRTTFASLDPFDRFKVEDLTNYAMNDQRWTLQRKKIGLKRHTSGAKKRKRIMRETKDLTLKFIVDHFYRKECQSYQKCESLTKKLGSETCKCGLEKHLHGSFNPLEPVTPMHKGLKKLHSKNSRRQQRTVKKSVLDFFSLNNIAEDITGEINQAFEEEEEEQQQTNVNIDEPLDNILNASGIQRRTSRTLDAGQPDPLRPPPVKAKTGHGVPWEFETAVTEYPTNAFGSITFVNETAGSNKPAKYVRLSDTTPIKSTLALLTEYWSLMEPNKPNLALSVIGGAKNFRLDGKKKEVFNTGLLRAVKSTQAWIITGGMQVGVTKCVGEAVNEGQYIVTVKRKLFFEEEQDHMVRGIKCLGIAPWGYVKDNETLVNESQDEFNEIEYKVEDATLKNAKVSLNGDHSHFLLVDNGSRNIFSGADKYKTELQKVIQEPIPQGLGIPVVILLLDGGFSSIVECKMALKNETPVVVVANTGRAADLIAYGRSMVIETPGGKFFFKKSRRKNLMSRIVATMPELGKDKCELCADLIVECCRMAHLITIFDINSNEGMDRSILYALLKGGGNSESTKIDKLNLALLWNRADIAENQIFPAYQVWPSESLEDLMTVALLDEKVEFVKLFAVNGLIMSHYLTVGRLRSLYNDTYNPDTHLGRLLSMCARSSNSYLVHVHMLLEALMKKHHDTVYMSDTPKTFNEKPDINYLTFEDPYQELLIWAILSNRTQLARYLWERCNSPMCAAIVATSIYESLWKSLGAKNTEIIDQYLKNKKMFEQLAVEFLDLCYKEDSKNAMSLVERRNAKWGDLDALQMARSANAMHFISSSCCQASVDISWRRGMIRASTLLVAIANIFPLLIFTRLFSFQKLGDNGGELTKFQKLIVFYKSPISKFCSHSSVFLLFLLVYSYLVLFDFRPNMSLAEKLVVIWIVTNMFEEINEFFGEDASTLKGKFRDWNTSVWNRFDMTSFFLAFVALILRLHPATFRWGRILYAINTNIFFIRLFRIYHVSYNLGPKLVIFYRMISEVFVFMSLLVIFILGYGIASQALLHPWRTFWETDISEIITGIFLTPYWQMYGELQLEKIIGDDIEKCPVNVDWNTEVCENPKDYTWVANMMLVFYLIIGNIMLLNLLIAIFTYVFDEVQENSMEIWKTEMYKLIREYDNKPLLVPPFVIIEHIYRISKYIWKKYFRKNRENLDDYMKQTLQSLEIFEKESLTKFLNNIREKKDFAIEATVEKMAEKIDKIMKYIEQEEELKELDEDTEWSVLEDYDSQHSSRSSSGRSKKSPKSRRSTMTLKSRKSNVINRRLTLRLDPSKHRRSKNLDPESLNIEAETENKTVQQPFDRENSSSSETDENDFNEEEEKDLEMMQQNSKVLTDGFASLPFNVGSSRPDSGVARTPRPRTTHQLRLRKSKRVSEQKSVPNEILGRVNDLESDLQNLNEKLEKAKANKNKSKMKESKINFEIQDQSPITPSSPSPISSPSGQDQENSDENSDEVEKQIRKLTAEQK